MGSFAGWSYVSMATSEPKIIVHLATESEGDPTMAKGTHRSARTVLEVENAPADTYAATFELDPSYYDPVSIVRPDPDGKFRLETTGYTNHPVIVRLHRTPGKEITLREWVGGGLKRAQAVLPDGLQIAVINASATISDAEIKKMLPAFERQWNHDLRPVWGVDPATFTFVPSGDRPVASAWWLVFLDDPVQAQNAAYHDLTDEAQPTSKVFMKTILLDRVSVSVAATQELVGMAVDPWLNRAYQDLQGAFWAAEITDPVQGDRYGYTIDDVLVTDFVTPDWFRQGRSGRPFDRMGHVTVPFQILSEGHAQKFDPDQGWVQIAGPMVRPSQLSENACVGSRGERRARRWKSRLERSRVGWAGPR
jgi:hypothetical protein